MLARVLRPQIQCKAPYTKLRTTRRQLCTKKLQDEPEELRLCDGERPSPYFTQAGGTAYEALTTITSDTVPVLQEPTTKLADVGKGGLYNRDPRNQ